MPFLVSALLAATTTVHDPRDAGGKLDLRSATALRRGALLILTISTYGEWSSTLLRSGGNGPSGPLAGKNRLTVLYDVNGDGKADFSGRIVYRGRLAMWITGKNQAFEPVPVSRPTRSSAFLTHPVDVLFSGKGTKTLRLAITSIDGAARDRMPNHGWISVPFG